MDDNRRNIPKNRGSVHVSDDINNPNLWDALQITQTQRV